ncbi:hypothetical protein [Wolbachia pipientis]|uniref:hypothetical protein n=1 Tax=Wolbachia pipientis TaxID=955 RepID=UPI00202F35F2|nr:hypothetical protein [Wolbachia pipientis]MCM1002155.1 hypothetical protein [Wolbachia pipientis]
MTVFSGRLKLQCAYSCDSSSAFSYPLQILDGAVDHTRQVKEMLPNIATFKEDVLFVSFIF